MSTDFRDRPSMLDAFGSRIPIYPAEAKGLWQKRRTWFQTVLLLNFLMWPWVRINGEQAVLFDLTQGKLAFFGLKFWAHDVPLLFLLLGSFAVGLALVTALWGRVWCGWACPQTVFLEGVIRRIERWTEGSHLQRRALDAAPFSFSKLRKKTFKWVLFVGFSALLTHSLLAYLFGSAKVLQMITSPPAENWGAFLFIVAITGLVLFDLTWFREQFCLIVCPYGRIQSVLMDSQTVTVQYDAARGEPRKTAANRQAVGACVDCRRCVSVCPTGVDIRNGIQLECISCTACIDACDDVMVKTNQPKGLIRYMASTTKPVKWLRGRVLLYGVMFVVLLAGLALVVGTRKDLDVVFLKTPGAPYFERVNEDGSKTIVNTYRAHFHNQSTQELRLSLRLPEGSQNFRLVGPVSDLVLKPEESRMVPFIIELPAASANPQESSRRVKLLLNEQEKEVEFVLPYLGS